MTKQELYQACKYEATEFTADHGMCMSELWSIVTGRAKSVNGMLITADIQTFWFDTVLEDYAMAGLI